MKDQKFGERPKNWQMITKILVNERPKIWSMIFRDLNNDY